MEISTPLVNGNESVQLKETISSSLSDQFYRQSKIDEENRRLKKKSKTDGKSKKKSSKKSDLPTVDDNDDDLYPTIKVTRGGELPEGMTESANDDNEEDSFGKKKNRKPDPHRALNIDLNEKPVVIQPPPEEPKPPSPPVEKPKKLKKKKTKEEEKVPIPPPPPVIEEKPKKKKKTKSPPPTDTNTSAPLLLDIMSDDISSINPSDQHSHGQDTLQLAAQSDHLIIVS